MDPDIGTAHPDAAEELATTESTESPPGETAPPGVDGRTARRDRNQQAVLDAVLALFREDNLQPKPEEVAARSGVSLRSVYRYYSEPPKLLLAAMARHLELIDPYWALPDIGQGSLEERVDRLIDRRSDLYERVGSTARAARLAAANNELIRAQFARGRQRLSVQVEEHFAPELRELTEEKRKAVSSAIDALLQLDGFEYYRVYRGFSEAETSRLLRATLLQLLGASS